MTSNTQLYDNALELLNKFASFIETNKEVNKEIISRQDIHYALALLQDQSGIIRTDYKLAKLCADCFMLGVYIANQPQESITLSEQQQATKCLNCQYIKSINGTFKCKLGKCKFE